MSKEAMKLALEALESCTPEDTSTSHVIYAWHDEELVNKAIKALEEALAKQEQGESVAWTLDSLEQEIYANTRTFVSLNVMEWLLTQLNTTPQQRKPLTDELIAYGKTASEMMASDQTRFDAACEVLRYLKQERVPYYYLHRMLTVIHGNEEAAHGIKE